MTRDSLAKLRALAEAATPGPWTFEQPECLYESIWAPNPAEPDALYDIPRNAEDQRFIAAANPAAVLSILDELAHIRRLAEEACDLANDVINEFELARIRRLAEEACELAREGYSRGWNKLDRRDAETRIAAIREEIGK